MDLQWQVNDYSKPKTTLKIVLKQCLKNFRLNAHSKYGGRDLSLIKTNYNATEREALAIVYNIRKFRNNLHGNMFTVRIDHIYALSGLRQ